MRSLVSWIALGLGVTALVVSVAPSRSITAERVILKDKNGIMRAVLDANSDVLISLFSSDEKEMFRITAHSDGAQIDLYGPDARGRVRLTTWGSNYLSIMDANWNKRIRVGDLWGLAIEGDWKRSMGMASEKNGKLEIYHQIVE